MLHVLTILCCALLLLASRLASASTATREVLLTRAKDMALLSGSELEYWKEHNLELDGVPALVWHVKGLLMQRRLPQALDMLEENEEEFTKTEVMKSYYQAFQLFLQSASGYGVKEEKWDELATASEDFRKAREAIAPDKILEVLAPGQYRDPEKCEMREALQLREIYTGEENRQKRVLVLWRLALLTAVTDPDQAFDYIVESFELFNQDGQYKPFPGGEPYIPQNILFRFVTLEVGDEKAREVAENLSKIQALIAPKDARKVIERARPEVIKQVTILSQQQPEPAAEARIEGGEVLGIASVAGEGPPLLDKYALYRSLRSVNIGSASEALIAAYADGVPRGANQSMDLQFVLEHVTGLDAGISVEDSGAWQSPRIFFALKNLWSTIPSTELHKVFKKLPVKLLVRISEPILMQAHEGMEPILGAARASVEERLARLGNSRNHSEYVYSLIALLRLGGLGLDPSQLRARFEEAVNHAHLTETEIIDLKETITSVSRVTNNPLLLLHLQAALANSAPISQLQAAFDGWKGILSMGMLSTGDQQDAYRDLMSSLQPAKLARILSSLKDNEEYGDLQRFYTEAVSNISSLDTREIALKLLFKAMAYRILYIDPISSPSELEMHKRDLFIFPAYQGVIFEECHQLLIGGQETRFAKRFVNCLIALPAAHPMDSLVRHWEMAMEMATQFPSNGFVNMLLTKAGGVSRLLDAMFPVIRPPSRLTSVAKDMYEASTQSTWRDRDVIVTRFAEYLREQPQTKELISPPSQPTDEEIPQEPPPVEIVCTDAFQASLYLGPTILVGGIGDAQVRQDTFNGYMERAELYLPKCQGGMIHVFTNQVISYLQRYPPDNLEDWPASENYAGPLLHAMVEGGAKKLAIRLYIRNRDIIDAERLSALLSSLSELDEFATIIPYLKQLSPESISMALTKVIEWPTFIDAIHASSNNGGYHAEGSNVETDDEHVTSRIAPHNDLDDLVLYYAVLGKLLDSDGRSNCTVDGGAQKIRQALVCIDAARLISPSHLLPIYDFAEALSTACPGAGGSHNSPIISPLTRTECLGSKLPVKGIFWTALADTGKYPENMDYTVQSLQIYRDQKEGQTKYLGKVRHFNNPANIIMMLQLARGTGMDAALRQELAEIPILALILTSRAVRREDAPKVPIFKRLHEERLVILPSPGQVRSMVTKAEGQELLASELQITLEEGADVHEVEALVGEEPIQEILLEPSKPFVLFYLGSPEENVQDTSSESKDADVTNDENPPKEKKVPVLKYASCKNVLGEQIKDMPKEDRCRISRACLIDLPEESLVAFLEHEDNLAQLTFQLTRNVVARLGPSFITRLSDKQLRSLWEAHPLLRPEDHPYMALQDSPEMRHALVEEGKNDVLRAEAYLVNPRAWNQEYMAEPMLNSNERPQLLANLSRDDFKVYLDALPEMHLDPISMSFLGAGVPPTENPCQEITSKILAEVPQLKSGTNAECQLYMEEAAWREEDYLFLNSLSEITDASEREKRERAHDHRKYERQRERQRRLTMTLAGSPSYYTSDEALLWQHSQLIEVLEDRMLRMSQPELDRLGDLAAKGELVLPSLEGAIKGGKDLEELNTFNVMSLKEEDFVIESDTGNDLLAPFRRLMMAVRRRIVQRLRDRLTQQRLAEQRKEKEAASRLVHFFRNTFSSNKREPPRVETHDSFHTPKTAPGIKPTLRASARVAALAGMRGETSEEDIAKTTQFSRRLIATFALAGVVLALVVVILPAILVFRRRNA